MRLFATLLAVAGVVAAHADLGLSLSYGFFRPQNSSVRGALGGQWTSIGFSPSTVSSGRGFNLGSDLNVLSREKGNNKVLLITGSFGPVQFYASPDNPDILPYAALRGSVTYADYRLTFGSTTFDRSRVLVGWNAEAGVIFNRTLTLSARYDAFQRVDGIQFDGFSINLMYQAFRF